MLRMFAVASLAMLGASPMSSAAAPGTNPASTGIHPVAFRGVPAAQDTVTASVAHMAMRAVSPEAQAMPLSQRDRLALLVLLSLHGEAGAAPR